MSSSISMIIFICICSLPLAQQFPTVTDDIYSPDMMNVVDRQSITARINSNGIGIFEPVHSRENNETELSNNGTASSVDNSTSTTTVDPQLFMAMNATGDNTTSVNTSGGANFDDAIRFQNNRNDTNNGESSNITTTTVNSFVASNTTGDNSTTGGADFDDGYRFKYRGINVGSDNTTSDGDVIFIPKSPLTTTIDPTRESEGLGAAAGGAMASFSMIIAMLVSIAVVYHQTVAKSS